jgi:integrase/recombinase XerD
VDLWISLKTSSHSQRAYRAELTRFRAFLPKPLASLTLADLTTYAAHLGQGSLKPSSQNRALTAIKSLLSFAHETGYLAFNVGAAIKLKPNRNQLSQRILSEDDVARLLGQAAAGRDCVILRLLYSSGVRVSELVNLKWCDAVTRAGAGQITVFGKGGRTRSILLDEETWRTLAGLGAEATPADPIFRSRKGGGLDPSQVRRIIYAAARRAGLSQKISPHWLRHAHASHALDNGAPIHLVQATLGHASVATTGQYLHARPADSSARYLRNPLPAAPSPLPG